MELLEAPLEALVFRYSAAAAGSLWAWIAVLAAALGLWRIRAVGSKSDAPPPPVPPSNAAPAPAKNPSHHQRPTSAARPLDCHEEGGSSPKGRFTAYFDADEWSSEEEEVGTGEFAGSPPPWERWGLGIRMRGDLGWYRYQDLTALNGSVVKLWESDGWLTAERAAAADLWE